MCFELLDNLHTNLDNEIRNLKIRSRDDNCYESANYYTNYDFSRNSIKISFIYLISIQIR